MRNGVNLWERQFVKNYCFRVELESLEFGQEEVSQRLAGEGGDQGVCRLGEPGKERGRCNILGVDLKFIV